MQRFARSVDLVPGCQSQSFLRKFRSQEIVNPAAFAALTAASVDWNAFSDRAGVMPVVCSQQASAKMALQSKFSGRAPAMALCARS